MRPMELVSLHKGPDSRIEGGAKVDAKWRRCGVGSAARAGREVGEESEGGGVACGGKVEVRVLGERRYATGSGGAEERSEGAPTNEEIRLGKKRLTFILGRARRSTKAFALDLRVFSYKQRSRSGPGRSSSWSWAKEEELEVRTVHNPFSSFGLCAAGGTLAASTQGWKRASICITTETESPERTTDVDIPPHNPLLSLTCDLSSKGAPVGRRTRQRGT